MGEFKGWLASQLKKHGWSHEELAQRSGVSRSLISQVLLGTRSPTADFCVKIALSLEVSPESLLRLAEILPPKTTFEDATFEDATVEEITAIVKTLSPEQRQQILDYARFISHQQQSKKF